MVSSGTATSAPLFIASYVSSDYCVPIFLHIFNLPSAKFLFHNCCLTCFPTNLHFGATHLFTYIFTGRFDMYLAHK